MAQISAIIRSMRLRTLPLSLSGVILGIMLAATDYHIGIRTTILIMLTTVCLQILSNMSNELGDVLNGTDTEDSQGPQYALNSGAMTIDEMKRVIAAFVVICIISGLVMIRVAFGTLFSSEALLMLLLGAASILAAMTYTLGRHPYGYRGFGDIAVFIFFGLASVLGAYFVSSHGIMHPLLLLPAAAIGFFCVGVLNLNNIRDMKTDAVNRVTVAIKLGIHRARIYQTGLIVFGWACMVAFCLMQPANPWHYLFILPLPLYAIHIKGVWTLTDRALDKMLPVLVMASFAFAILAGIGMMVSGL